MIAQWNSAAPVLHSCGVNTTPPSPMCGTANGGFGDGQPLWSVETGALRVCVLKNSAPVFVVQLAQNGANVPCGKEYDLFLSPTSSTWDTKFLNVNEVPLGKIASLNLEFGVHLIDVAVTPRCGASGSCGPGGHLDYSYFVLGLPLSNPVKKQTNFFQVLLFDTRQDEKSCGVNPCDPSRDPSWYFTELPTLGVSYTVASIFQNSSKCIRNDASKAGSQQWYSMNGNVLLSALIDAVKQGAEKYGADGDLNNWRVGSWYIGSGLQGSVASTINVAFSRFEAVLK